MQNDLLCTCLQRWQPTPRFPPPAPNSPNGEAKGSSSTHSIVRSAELATLLASPYPQSSRSPSILLRPNPNGSGNTPFTDVYSSAGVVPALGRQGAQRPPVKAELGTYQVGRESGGGGGERRPRHGHSQSGLLRSAALFLPCLGIGMDFPMGNKEARKNRCREGGARLRKDPLQSLPVELIATRGNG